MGKIVILCKHCVEATVPHPIYKFKYYACLKKQNPIEARAINLKLHSLGLTGSGVTNMCPVAIKGVWDRCPFREE